MPTRSLCGGGALCRSSDRTRKSFMYMLTASSSSHVLGLRQRKLRDVYWTLKRSKNRRGGISHGIVHSPDLPSVGAMRRRTAHSPPSSEGPFDFCPLLPSSLSTPCGRALLLRASEDEIGSNACLVELKVELALHSRKRKRRCVVSFGRFQPLFRCFLVVQTIMLALAAMLRKLLSAMASSDVMCRFSRFDLSSLPRPDCASL